MLACLPQSHVKQDQRSLAYAACTQLRRGVPCIPLTAYQLCCRLQLLSPVETDTAHQPNLSHSPQLSEAVAHCTLQTPTDFQSPCQLRLLTSPQTETRRASQAAQAWRHACVQPHMLCHMCSCSPVLESAKAERNL